MKVPSCSNTLAAGRKTVANSRAVSLMKMSWTITVSTLASASRVSLRLGSVGSTS
jgi:hypothetical protein